MTSSITGTQAPSFTTLASIGAPLAPAKDPLDSTSGLSIKTDAGSPRTDAAARAIYEQVIKRFPFLSLSYGNEAPAAPSSITKK